MEPPGRNSSISGASSSSRRRRRTTKNRMSLSSIEFTFPNSPPTSSGSVIPPQQPRFPLHKASTTSAFHNRTASLDSATSLSCFSSPGSGLLGETPLTSPLTDPLIASPYILHSKPDLQDVFITLANKERQVLEARDQLTIAELELAQFKVRWRSILARGEHQAEEELQASPKTSLPNACRVSISPHHDPTSLGLGITFGEEEVINHALNRSASPDESASPATPLPKQSQLHLTLEFLFRYISTLVASIRHSYHLLQRSNKVFKIPRVLYTIDG